MISIGKEVHSRSRIRLALPAPIYQCSLSDLVEPEPTVERYASLAASAAGTPTNQLALAVRKKCQPCCCHGVAPKIDRQCQLVPLDGREDEEEEEDGRFFVTWSGIPPRQSSQISSVPCV